jgi:hypothetical protein
MLGTRPHAKVLAAAQHRLLQSLQPNSLVASVLVDDKLLVRRRYQVALVAEDDEPLGSLGNDLRVREVGTFCGGEDISCQRHVSLYHRPCLSDWG